jgi:multidrug efflux pump subunit AcrA (membrane-fusion protein)
VLTGQKGQFVFAVKEDMTAEVRPVVVSRTSGEESVIESGLTPGEKVVTDGQIRIMPGAKVEIKGDREKREGREVRSEEQGDKAKGEGQKVGDKAKGEVQEKIKDTTK